MKEWRIRDMQRERDALQDEIERLKARIKHMKVMPNPPRLHNLMTQREESRLHSLQYRLDKIKALLLLNAD